MKNEIEMFFSQNTPISEVFLKLHLRATTENNGTMPCYKINIITNGSRTLTIAKWGDTHYYYGSQKIPKEQEWQVWLDTFDLCRIKYMEQLTSLMYGLNAKVDNR
jgi:hypothetical protein